MYLKSSAAWTRSAEPAVHVTVARRRSLFSSTHLRGSAVFKVMFVVYERSGLTRDEALRYWRDNHGPIAAKVPGLRRYVQSHAIAAPAGELPFLGIAEMVFDDADSFNAAAQSSEFAAVLEDVVNFADPDRVPTAFMDDFSFIG
jgi:uncharacterized protein (TIGR02118 family)